MRKALFALKRVFQEDHEFVQEFVANEGLCALVEVGRQSEQSIQQYVLRGEDYNTKIYHPLFVGWWRMTLFSYMCGKSDIHVERCTSLNM